MGLRAQTASDSVLVLTNKELAAVQKLADQWKEIYGIQVNLTKVAEKQKWKWVKIAIVAILVAIGEFVVDHL